MMDNKLRNSLLVGGLGAIGGAVMGVAAFGGAVNAAYVFGPIGLIMGWLIPVRDKPSNSDAESSSVGQVSNDSSVPEVDLQKLKTSVSEMLPILAKITLSVWNLLMRLLIAIGAIELFVKRPWLFVVLAIVLLGLVYPVGIVFSILGIVANNYGSSSSNNFIVDLNRSV
jgi:hypothetical protein